ncbi:MAG: hypothetical protein R6X34_07850 [Chloroflexota bacterium]
MIATKIKITTAVDDMVTLPVLIPDLNEVRELARQLHKAGMAWQGEFFGWQAEYNPERAKRPLDSNMTYTPADFCIGESGIWFFSLMWEKGKEERPVEFLDDLGVVNGNRSLPSVG